MRKALPSIVAVFVAVSVAWAAASYPTSVKVFTTKAQNETIQPAHMNDVQDEIVAVEQGLLNGFQHDLKPDTDGGRALGTTALRFKNLRLFLGTLTDQLAAIDITGTWNDAADTFTAIKVNITDTASAAASLLMDLQVGGVSKFRVDKSGKATVGADPTAALDVVTKQYADAQAGVLDADTSSTAVTNTAVETTVYSFSVPGGTLSTARAIRVILIGEVLNNNEATNDLTIRAKYGGTTVGGSEHRDITLSANRRGFWTEVIIQARGATNAQSATFLSAMQGGVLGEIDAALFTASSPFRITNHTSLAIDSAVAQTFSITAQWAVAGGTSTEFKMVTAYMEIIQ